MAYNDFDFDNTGVVEVGGPSAVELEAKATEERAKAQSWTDTLGFTDEADTTNIVEGTKAAFQSGGNFAYDLYESVKRMYDNTPDPNWKPDEWLKQNADAQGVDIEYYGAVMGTQSMGEANDLLRDIRKRQANRKIVERMGLGGQLTSGALAGVLDLDVLATGGFALAGKAGILGTRIGQVAAGTAAATGAATLGAAASPEDDWANVGVAALFSLGVGTGAAGLSGPINKSIVGSVDELDKHLLQRQASGVDFEPLPTGRNPDAWESPEVRAKQEELVNPPDKIEGEKQEVPEVLSPDAADDIYTKQLGGSIGAAQITTDRIGVKLSDDAAVDVQTFAKQINRDKRLDQVYYDEYAPALDGNTISKGVAKIADATTRALNRTGLRADFDKFMNSNSPVLKAMAYLGMRDPTSRVANNANAASWHQSLNSELMGTFYPVVQSEMTAYTKRMGLNKLGGFATPFQRRAAQREFYQKVHLEQENMRLDGAYSKTIDPEVKAVAQAMDEWSLKEHRIAFGDGERTMLPGWDQFDPYKGYMAHPLALQRVYGDIRKSVEDAANGIARVVRKERDFEDMFAGYFATSPTFRPKDARNAARMVMAYARNSDQGMSVDINSLYNRATADAFHAMAENIGISKADANELAKRIEKFSERRGQQNQTKQRIDGDVRYVHPNGLKIIDYIDTDIMNTYTRRSRNTSGRAALARGMGIRTDEDMRAWKAAAMNEQAQAVETVKDLNYHATKTPNVTSEDIDGFFAQFTGATIQGDTMAGWVMRAKRWTGMSSLGNTGMWQIAETSNLVGAAGWADFVRNLPAAIRGELTNPRSELIKELRVLGKFIPEERMTNPYFHGDMNTSLQSQNALMQFVDRVGARGMHAQGLITGMFKVREIQHNLSTFIAIDKLMKSVRGVDGGFSEARLYQMGATEEFVRDLKSVADKMEYDPATGDVIRMNIASWRDGDLEYRLLNTLNTFTDQQVQRAIAGESNTLMAGNGVSSLFTQFLTYPMQAINKQMARQSFAGDTEALYTAMYGFLFGGTIGMAKVVTSGRYEDLDLQTFAKSGFQNANLTGWMPNFSDPLLELVGMDDWKFNPNGGIIRNPPAISVLNSIATAPFAGVRAMFGDFSSENMNKMRLIPMLGNHPAWVSLINALKD